MNLSLVGIDLAKNVFHVTGMDVRGNILFSRKLVRSKIASFFANLPICTVAMEACGGCFYWARLFKSQGHFVKIIPAQFVKPFLKSGKNDCNDSIAICEAAQRPTMRTVATKTIEQQDAELEHAYRRRLVGSRTKLVNEIRSLLHEYGIVLPVSVRKFKDNVCEVVEDGSSQLTIKCRNIIKVYIAEFISLTNRLNEITKKIENDFDESEVGQRLKDIPGVGPISGSAFVSLASHATQFKNGRSFAAWLGLVPSQYSSGGKEILGRINKKGNTYLRTLLIHGSRAVLSKAKLKSEIRDPRVKWGLELASRKGMNKAVVAYANKNARVIWHLLTKENEKYIYA